MKNSYMGKSGILKKHPAEHLLQRTMRHACQHFWGKHFTWHTEVKVEQQATSLHQNIFQIKLLSIPTAVYLFILSCVLLANVWSERFSRLTTRETWTMAFLSFHLMSLANGLLLCVLYGMWLRVRASVCLFRCVTKIGTIWWDYTPCTPHA